MQAYLAGLTFALAASPCSTPVLATLLGYVAASRVFLESSTNSLWSLNIIPCSKALDTSCNIYEVDSGSNNRWELAVDIHNWLRNTSPPCCFLCWSFAGKALSAKPCDFASLASSPFEMS